MTENALMYMPKELIVKNGKSVGVILSIETYEEILERLKDIEDLKMLKAMRQNSLKFRKLEDFLQEYRR
ncbi:MAG: type II toxin-antitoxin system Phd/YefM family antitoxin [Candidatus Omnitrophica bacterium]|nr:type II toxin-antitoxin system Phd/YefM family antitoxin [Candidatus Omnitrophota bacterium]